MVAVRLSALDLPFKALAWEVATRDRLQTRSV